MLRFGTNEGRKSEKTSLHLVQLQAGKGGKCFTNCREPNGNEYLLMLLYITDHCVYQCLAFALVLEQHTEIKDPHSS